MNETTLAANEEENNFIPIVYVNHGIANRFKDRIEINKNLKKYPELYKQVLEHEFSHTNRNFSFKDLFIDVGIPSNNIKQLIMFMITNPRSFSQIFPFYISNKKIVYDINMIIIYSFLFTIITGTVLFAWFI